MKKIYCDCCGKEIICGPRGNRATRVGRDIPILCNPGYGQMNKRLDMCVECDVAFVNFWNQRSREVPHDSVINTILFDNIDDALEVLDVLEDIAHKYGYATEADLLEATGLLDDVEPNELSMRYSYGWNENDIISAGAIKDGSAYHIVIQPARKISDIILVKKLGGHKNEN